MTVWPTIRRGGAIGELGHGRLVHHKRAHRHCLGIVEADGAFIVGHDKPHGVNAGDAGIPEEYDFSPVLSNDPIVLEIPLVIGDGSVGVIGGGGIELDPVSGSGRPLA